MSTPLTPSFRFPATINQDAAHPTVVKAVNQHTKGIVDLNQAISALKSQIDTITGGMSSTTTIEGGSTTIINGSSFPGLGGVNDQTGQIAYTVQAADSGILLILNDSSAVAVTLNSSLTTPYFLFIANFGSGTATLTPSSGNINGSGSFALPLNSWIMAVFNGTNWQTSPLLTLPQSVSPVLHQWLKSYDASTGLFTETQPDYSDLTGTPALPAAIAPVAGEYLTGYNAGTGAFSQSTPAGISATITTAALTSLGTQGSMTFVGGLLTAQTPAT